MVESEQDAAQLRAVLLPLWLATHAGWGDLPPRPPSRFMCRYTAELIALLDPRWRTVLGRVDGHTHAWCERRRISPDGPLGAPIDVPDAAFLDLTGDQFGRPPVVHTTSPPPGYTAGDWPDAGDGEPFRRRARSWLTQLRARPAWVHGHPAPLGGRAQPCLADSAPQTGS